MPNMVTNTRSVVGIRKRPSTPRLASYASTRGPSEVPPRNFQTRVTLGAYPRNFGMGDLQAVNRTADVPVPFDPAEFAPNQVNIPEQANPPDGAYIPNGPTQICPAWGCNYRPGSPVMSAPGAPIPTPVSTTPTAPVIIPPPILIPSGSSQGPAAGTPVSTAGPSTLVATSPSLTSVAASTLTATQIAAGAVGFNTAGQPVDVNGNPIGTFAEITAWLGESTLISGMPNWILPVGLIGAFLLFKKK